MENKNYISIPENEYKELIKSLEKHREENNKLFELLDTKDNIIIFENKSKLWEMVSTRFNYNYVRITSTEKQEYFLSEVDKKMKEVKENQLRYKNKYGNIPKWVVSFFNKNK